MSLEKRIDALESRNKRYSALLTAVIATAAEEVAKLEARIDALQRIFDLPKEQLAEFDDSLEELYKTETFREMKTAVLERISRSFIEHLHRGDERKEKVLIANFLANKGLKS